MQKIFKVGDVVRIRKFPNRMPTNVTEDLEAWSMYDNCEQFTQCVGSFSSLDVGLVICVEERWQVTVVKVITSCCVGWIYGDLIEPIK